MVKKRAMTDISMLVGKKKDGTYNLIQLFQATLVTHASYPFLPGHGIRPQELVHHRIEIGANGSARGHSR